jgi:hypothetical protein
MLNHTCFLIVVTSCIEWYVPLRQIDWQLSELSKFLKQSKLVFFAVTFRALDSLVLAGNLEFSLIETRHGSAYCGAPHNAMRADLAASREVKVAPEKYG